MFDTRARIDVSCSIVHVGKLADLKKTELAAYGGTALSRTFQPSYTDSLHIMFFEAVTNPVLSSSVSI